MSGCGYASAYETIDSNSNGEKISESGSATHTHYDADTADSDSGSSYSAYHTLTQLGEELANNNKQTIDDSTINSPSTAAAAAAAPSLNADDADFLTADHNWQLRFERILSSPSSTASARLDKATRLRALMSEFTEAAMRVGRQIIEDLPLPVSAKRFKPLSGKGVAGGEKYCAAQLFIKLTGDAAGIYGGCYGAAKAAKHEIRSLQALIECAVDGLMVPLMCVIDFLGHRLVATSLIEGLGDDTLVYGSQDAGRTINTRDANMNAIIKKACEQLNLKAHNVIAQDGRARLLYGPADLEGHRVVKDGVTKYYLLDFARLFPPEAFTVAPSGRRLNGFVIFPELARPVKPFSTEMPAKTFAAQFLQEATVTYKDKQRNSERVDSETRQAFEEQMHAQRERNDAIRARNAKALDEWRAGGEAGEQPHTENEEEPIGDLEELPLAPQWLARPEGLLCFNSRSLGSFNPRASAIAGRVVCGPALIGQNTGGVFFRLLRPELLRRAVEPLSSDGFSGFGCCARCRDGVCAHCASSHHQAIEEVTQAISGTGHNRLIEELADKINQRLITPADAGEIIKEMHRAGINVRYLGLLRNVVTIEYIREIILCEMITRTVRHILTTLLRAVDSQSTQMTINIQGHAQHEQKHADDEAHAYDNVENINAPASAPASARTKPLERTPSLSRGPSSNSSSGYVSHYECGLLYPVPIEADTSAAAFPIAQSDDANQRALTHADVSVRLLNLLFGVGPLSARFWCGRRVDDESDESDDEKCEPNAGGVVMAILMAGTGGELRAALLRKFPDGLTQSECRRDYDLRAAILKFPLLFRLQGLTGLKLTQAALERVFRASEAFECEEPFAIADIEGFQAKARGVDQDEAINEYLYTLAIEGQGAAASSESAIRAAYHESALRCLGPSHPLVIASQFKLALDSSAAGRHEEAQAFVSAGLERCAATYGIYSLHYTQGLITAGETLMHALDHQSKAGCPLDSVCLNRCIEYFSSALFATERNHTRHPLIAKLCAYLGRIQLMAGAAEIGVDYLARSQSLYTEFYGPHVSAYLGPVITMGKATELAHTMGHLALAIKPIVAQLQQSQALTNGVIKAFQQAEREDALSRSVRLAALIKAGQHVPGPIVYEQYQQLRSTISMLEEMNGLPKGFYYGKSLELRTRPVDSSMADAFDSSIAADEAAALKDDPLHIDAHTLLAPRQGLASQHAVAMKKHDIRMKAQEKLELRKLASGTDIAFGYAGARVNAVNSFFIRSHGKPPEIVIQPPQHALFPNQTSTPLLPLIVSLAGQSDLYEVLFATAIAGAHNASIHYYDRRTSADGPVAPSFISVDIPVSCGAPHPSCCSVSVSGLPAPLQTGHDYSIEVSLFDSNHNTVTSEEFLSAFERDDAHGRTSAHSLSTNWHRSGLELSFQPAQQLGTVRLIKLSRIDYDNGRLVFAITPNRDGAHNLSVSFHDVRLHRSTVDVVAPAGQGFCRLPVNNFTIGAAAAALCTKCTPLYRNCCLFCKGPLFMNSSFARFCHSCAVRRRCVVCAAPAPPLIIAQGQAQICNQCNTKNLGKMCAGRI